MKPAQDDQFSIPNHLPPPSHYHHNHQNNHQQHQQQQENYEHHENQPTNSFLWYGSCAYLVDQQGCSTGLLTEI